MFRTEDMHAIKETAFSRTAIRRFAQARRQRVK
jgi:hypothetical protein